ncbi:hypothetical protein ACFQ6N_00705 [Kitasatospora sp. NPDC056446]|uniref:hypothetical protein n=1 Tax=Kitasatospora sp. NPDC056446 TaxID=3345819 RepID=UPI003674BB2C
MTAGVGSGHTYAVRLIVEYEGTSLRLVSRQRVEMTSPPGDRLAGPGEAQGFWVEVRDRESNVLYRRVLNDPVQHDAEVFSADPGQSVARVPVATPKGAFAVLVPDIEAADYVALVSSPLGAGTSAARAPAVDVARFALRGGPDDGPDDGSDDGPDHGSGAGEGERRR